MLSRCTSLPGIPPASTAAEKSRHPVTRAAPVDDEGYLSVLRADILRLHTLGTRRRALDDAIPEGPPLEALIRSAEKGLNGRGVAAAGLLEIFVDKVMDAAIVGLKDTESAEYKVPKHLVEGRRSLSFIDPVVALIERLRQLHSQAYPVARRTSLRSAGKKRSARCTTACAATQTDKIEGPLVPPLSASGKFDAAGFFKDVAPDASDRNGILLQKKHVTGTQALVAELSALKATVNKKEKALSVTLTNPAPSPPPRPQVRAAASQTNASSISSTATQTNTTPRSAKEEPKRRPSKESSQQTESSPSQVRGTQTESAVSDQARLLRVLRVEQRRSPEKPEIEIEAEESKCDKVQADRSTLQALQALRPEATATPNSINPKPQVQQAGTCSASGSDGCVSGISRRRHEQRDAARSKSQAGPPPPLLRCPQNHGMQWIYRKELKVPLACLRCQAAINGMDGFHFCAICSHDTQQRHSICAKCSSDERLSKSYCQSVVKSASDGSLTATAANRAQVKAKVCPQEWALVSAALPTSPHSF